MLLVVHPIIQPISYVFIYSVNLIGRFFMNVVSKYIRKSTYLLIFVKTWHFFQVTQQVCFDQDFSSHSSLEHYVVTTFNLTKFKVNITKIYFFKMISSRKLLMNSCLSLSRRTYFQGGSNDQAAKIEDYERYISRVK